MHYLRVKFSEEVSINESESQSCTTLRPHELCNQWNSLGQNTGVGSHSLLQESSKPRDQTQVSRIAGGFFTSWIAREAQEYWSA